MSEVKQRYRVRMTTTCGVFWMGRSLSDGVCGWVLNTSNASHYQMLTAAKNAAQQRWLDITSVFGDVQAIDVVNDQGELVWRGSREDVRDWMDELTETQADLDRCVNLLLMVQHIQTVPDMNRLARVIQDVQKRIARRKAAAKRQEAQP